MLAFSTSRSILSMTDMRVKDIAGTNAIELGPNREMARFSLPRGQSGRYAAVVYAAGWQEQLVFMCEGTLPVSAAACRQV